MKFTNFAAMACIAFTLTACAETQEFCVAGTAAPGLGVPCAVAGIVKFSKDYAQASSSNNDPTQPALKTFQVSKLLMKDFGDNSDVMSFVMDSQDKYKAGDYGMASDEQKKAKIGRYRSDQLGKTIVIRDSDKAWNVAYESES